MHHTNGFAEVLEQPPDEVVWLEATERMVYLWVAVIAPICITMLKATKAGTSIDRMVVVSVMGGGGRLRRGTIWV